MKVAKILFFLQMIVGVLILASCCESRSQYEDPELQKLKAWMTGSFSSQQQAEADTNFYDIRLEMVPIWEKDNDTTWLYVEQAASWALEKPYRQRVYRLTKTSDGSFESAVFLINNPLQYAGAFNNSSLLGILHPDSIRIKDGCSLFLRFGNDEFTGTTDEKSCPSNLRGAAYATSKVAIRADVLESLDRGYDSVGNQVWGSEYGPYIFRKLIASDNK